MSETVGSGKTERKLESRQLLVGSQRLGRRQLQCLAVHIFMIGMETQECSQRPARSHIITGFEIHTPATDLICKISTDRCVHLPVHIKMKVIFHLCLSFQTENGQYHQQYELFLKNVSYRFHNLPDLLFISIQYIKVRRLFEGLFHSTKRQLHVDT